MTDSVAPKLAPIANRSGKAPGFTLLEILVALTIVAILCAVSVPAYNTYINKAKLTVATNTLGATRKILENYYIDYGNYPVTIDFATGLDNQGREVLPQDLMGDFNNNIFSVESYVAASAQYTLIVRAKDNNHTLLTLTNHRLNQGP